jgi:hypothetical protein
MKKSEGMRLRINTPDVLLPVNVEQVAQRYILGRMPSRHSTSRGYKRKLNIIIILRDLGMKSLPLKPYEVDQWLKTLKSEGSGKLFAPKTKTHIKNVLHMRHGLGVRPCWSQPHEFDSD